MSEDLYEILISTLSKVATPITGTIAVVGTITNGISLSYFSRRRQEGVGNKFLVLLNVVDTLLCCLAASQFIVIPSWWSNFDEDSIDGGYIICLVFLISAYLITMEISALLTVSLCVVRTLTVICPLLQIRKRLPFAIVSAIICYIAGREAYTACTVLYPQTLSSFEGLLNNSATLEVYNHAQYLNIFLLSMILLDILIMVVVVAVCCAISIRKLSTPNEDLGETQVSRINRKAMVTVLILSSLFIAFNSAMMATESYIRRNKEGTVSQYVVHAMLVVFSNSLMPINSALNPVVYMLRIEGLNDYTKQIFRRVLPRGGRHEREDIAIELDHVTAQIDSAI